MTSSHPASTSLGTSFPDSSVPSTGNYYESTIMSSWTTGSHGGPITTPPGDFNGSFYQMKDYHQPSDHALVADSIFWITTSYYIAKGDTATCAPILATNNNTVTPPAAEGQTWADFYRHGDYPKIVSSGATRTSAGTTGYDPHGGKIGYNILFCDGHVITSHSGTDAFLYFRMRYPG
jgi:prepilin-type processing-associated H-X9-DG protein